MRDKYVIFCTITEMTFGFKSCQTATSQRPQAALTPSAHARGAAEAVAGPAQCAQQRLLVPASPRGAEPATASWRNHSVDADTFYLPLSILLFCPVSSDRKVTINGEDILKQSSTPSARRDAPACLSRGNLCCWATPEASRAHQ